MHRFVHSLPFYFLQRTIASPAVIPVIHRPVPKKNGLWMKLGMRCACFGISQVKERFDAKLSTQSTGYFGIR